jgi:putative ABC transport system permease protein
MSRSRTRSRATRLYRLLLRVYPASFRHEYGEELCRLHAERRAGASRSTRLALWREALADAAVTAPRVHADILRHDLRYACRALLRAPIFAATAMLVIAIGIGATTATFSVANRVLFPALPYEAPDRIVRIWEKTPGYAQMEPSPANYRDWRQMATAFDAMGAYTSMPVSLVRGHSERLTAVEVTEEVFGILGARPALGRRFVTGDYAPAAGGTVVISDALWRRAFGADPGVIGRTMRLESDLFALEHDTFEIVGVMPQEFYYPDRETELWIPARFDESVFRDRDNNFLSVVARLAGSVSLADARAQMDGIMANLERAYPKENANSRATVRLVADQVPSQSRVLVRVLGAASACVLLIACSNLASLLLTRFTTRRREIAVRTALGAGRERLIRLMLTESVLLSAAGGAGGVALAAVAVPLLARLVPTSLPIPAATPLEPEVLGFAAALTILTGILFGVLPALRACRGTDATALRDRQSSGGGRERLRQALVVAQVAASIVLLVCAALLTRALLRVQALDPGFEADRVLTMRTALPPGRYPTTAGKVAFFDRVRAGVQALPGVDAAAYTSGLPMVMRGGVWPVGLPQIEASGDDPEQHRAILRFVTPGYFRVLQIPLRRGRDIAESDTAQSPFVAVVSESFARRYWPGEDPLGRTFTFAFFERTIVGVVGDVRVRGLEGFSEPQVYLSYKQVPDGGLPFYAPKDLLVRTAGDPLAAASAVRAVVAAADPALPATNIRSMTDVVALETGARRTQIAVLACFTIAAVMLAATGIHGLLAFSVSQRVQEIGIRVALGATRGTVLRLILGQGVTLALAGSAMGVAAAYGSARALGTLLAGVSPADVPAFVTAITVTVLMTLSGSAVPAVRALAIDPATAVRG